ncbi:UbiA prenyltransferase family [Gloeopeniophorella convolvens]|nr:UbiA prenyltransferase family [Gloeopeniophorella convolvens]
MAAQALSHNLYTLFLFTKSDMKTLIPPVTLFAAAAAPKGSPLRLLHVIFWMWVHCLQLAFANQTLPRAIAEDTLNHRDRPIPAGRITVRTARMLRWAMIPICVLISAAYGPRTMLASLGSSLFMLAYNEGGGANSHWLIRNALNAVGYAVAEAGATLVACPDESAADSTVFAAVALSAGIILTTIHTQDYKDVRGDAASGRVTLPIAYPMVSRIATAFLLIGWSWGVAQTWRLDDVAAAVMGVLSLVVGIRFVARTDVRADKVSFYWYNASIFFRFVWLCAAYTLPGYYRMRMPM